MRKLLIIIIIPVVFILNTFCEDTRITSKEVITIKGSDTMVNLTQKWAEEYMKMNSDVSIQVTGGGSGTGIAALLNGTADIINVSRELKKNEIESAGNKGIHPKKHRVALDGIAVIVHPSNPIDTIDIETLRKIFSGKINNWNDISDKQGGIILYGRENSSGTYEFIKSEILESDNGNKILDFAKSTNVLQGTAALGEAVARDVNGIGYGGVGYFAKRDDLKVLHVKYQSDLPAISPVHDKSVNYSIIWDGTYPLSRYLYCYTNGNPDGELKKYINFITSPEGQEIVKEMEYIPLSGYDL